MPDSRIINQANDLGRHLTADVVALALLLPVVAHDAFYAVVLPFVFAASLSLVVLFALPFRDLPFAAVAASAGLNTFRNIILGSALVNILAGGSFDIEFLSGRWLLVTMTAVLSLLMLTIDIRRITP